MNPWFINSAILWTATQATQYIAHNSFTFYKCLPHINTVGRSCRTVPYMVEITKCFWPRCTNRVTPGSQRWTVSHKLLLSTVCGCGIAGVWHPKFQTYGPDKYEEKLCQWDDCHDVMAKHGHCNSAVAGLEKRGNLSVTNKQLYISLHLPFVRLVPSSPHLGSDDHHQDK